MNAYIFIAMSICDIGGSEQYINNKKEYLKNHGFDVYVFSGMTRDVLIDGLKEDIINVIPALMYAPCYFTQHEIQYTISDIKQRVMKCHSYKKIFIESDGIDEAQWGELLAEKLHGKHIVFNVQEKHNYTDKEISFLLWKYERKELYGITKESVNMMLKMKVSNYSYNTVFEAYCSNVVEDCADSFSVLLLKDAYLTIGSIGRIEKEYVIPMIKMIISITTINPDKKFNLLLIGGGKDDKITKEIKSIVEKQKNINLIITGLLFPIPRSLIKKCDLFISTSGSATVTFNEKIPTIKIHPITAEPCGIIGLSFNPEKDTMYNVLQGETYSSLIKQIQTNGEAITYPDNPYKSYFDGLNREFMRQLCFFDNKTTCNYYDIKTIKHKPNSIKRAFYYLLGKCCGGYMMQRVLESIRKIIY